MSPLRTALAFCLLGCLGAPPGLTHAQALPDDPYAYDLRVGLYPVAFVGGLSQSQFGSAARAELDLGRRFTAQLAGRAGWAGVAGETDDLGWAGRVVLMWHIIDQRTDERLGGTIYPEDTPAAGGRTPATDSDLHVPMSQKLGGPRLTLPEKDRERVAPVRKVHTARLGGEYLRAVQRARPSGGDGEDRHVLNTLPALFVGYAWGTHYNLSKASAGAREVGFRRYYVDVLLSLESWADTEPLDTDPAPDREFFPAGLRIGMEGTMAAMLDSAPGVGFAYSLELGALPGESGVEGYLLVGLGLALDAALSP